MRVTKYETLAFGCTSLQQRQNVLRESVRAVDRLPNLDYRSLTNTDAKHGENNTVDSRRHTVRDK